MDMFLALIAATCLVLAGCLILDRLIPWAVRRCAPLLPRDLVGPDGWLVDTRNGRGVFDRTRMDRARMS